MNPGKVGGRKVMNDLFDDEDNKDKTALAAIIRITENSVERRAEADSILYRRDTGNADLNTMRTELRLEEGLALVGDKDKRTIKSDSGVAITANRSDVTPSENDLKPAALRENFGKAPQRPCRPRKGGKVGERAKLNKR